MIIFIKLFSGTILYNFYSDISQRVPIQISVILIDLVLKFTFPCFVEFLL